MAKKTVDLRALKRRFTQYLGDVKLAGALSARSVYPKLPPLLKRRSAADLLDEERGDG